MLDLYLLPIAHMPAAYIYLFLFNQVKVPYNFPINTSLWNSNKTVAITRTGSLQEQQQNGVSHIYHSNKHIHILTATRTYSHYFTLLDLNPPQ